MYLHRGIAFFFSFAAGFFNVGVVSGFFHMVFFGLVASALLALFFPFVDLIAMVVTAPTVISKNWEQVKRKLAKLP